MHPPNRNVSNLTTVASRVLYETLNNKSVSETSSIRRKMKGHTKFHRYYQLNTIYIKEGKITLERKHVKTFFDKHKSLNAVVLSCRFSLVLFPRQLPQPPALISGKEREKS